MAYRLFSTKRAHLFTSHYDALISARSWWCLRDRGRHRRYLWPTAHTQRSTVIPSSPSRSEHTLVAFHLSVLISGINVAVCTGSRKGLGGSVSQLWTALTTPFLFQSVHPSPYFSYFICSCIFYKTRRHWRS